MSLEEEIGPLAGEIWQFLRLNGESTALKLRVELKIPHSRLYLALGWLCREDQINVVFDDRGCRVSLKP